MNLSDIAPPERSPLTELEIQTRIANSYGSANVPFINEFLTPVRDTRRLNPTQMLRVSGSLAAALEQAMQVEIREENRNRRETRAPLLHNITLNNRRETTPFFLQLGEAIVLGQRSAAMKPKASSKTNKTTLPPVADTDWTPTIEERIRITGDIDYRETGIPRDIIAGMTGTITAWDEYSDYTPWQVTFDDPLSGIWWIPTRNLEAF